MASALVGTGDTGTQEAGIMCYASSIEFAVSTEMCNSRFFDQAKA